MLCLTGLPLVFYDDIEELQGKTQTAPPMQEGTPMASLDDIIRVGKQQQPNDVVRYVYWDDEQPNPVMLNMAGSINAPADVYKLLVFDARTAWLQWLFFCLESLRGRNKQVLKYSLN